ncbi:MAG: DNA-binding protein, partial [Cyanobacteria bacterium P01_H01_bin.130]
MTAGTGKTKLTVRGFQSGRSLTLEDSGKGGGEGRIYHVAEDPTLVAKIYHPQKRKGDQLLKLQAMLNNPPVDPGGDNPAIAWPVDLVGMHERPEQILGFLMPRVDQVRPLHHFYTPKTRREEIIGFTYHYLLRMARNLAATFHAVHERGYVVGDVNESNILASSSTLVTLVDTDSFQVPDGDRTYRCGVGRPEFTPPELQGKNLKDLNRTPANDAFGLAVLIFQLLMEGTHPFDGVYTGRGDPPLKNQRIMAGHFPYGRRRSPYKPKPIAPSFRHLDPILQTLFQAAFETGHRDPQRRPDAQTWVMALDQAEARLTTCQRNDRHVYSNHQKHCPWCARTEKFKGRDPFPSRDAVRKGEHRQPVRQRQKRPRTVVKGSPSLRLPLLAGSQTGIVP